MGKQDCDMVGVPGRLGQFFIPTSGRVIKCDSIRPLCVRIPLWNGPLPLGEVEFFRKAGGFSSLSTLRIDEDGTSYWGAFRLPAHRKWEVTSIVVPPWQGWRPSWESRPDPGLLLVKVGQREILRAPLLALADAHLAGAAAPTGGVTSQCDHCGAESPRDWRKPECFNCGGPLRLSAEVVSPHLKPALRPPEHRASQLVICEDWNDDLDLYFELIPSPSCPSPFLCHVELRGEERQPIGT